MDGWLNQKGGLERAAFLIQKTADIAEKGGVQFGKKSMFLCAFAFSVFDSQSFRQAGGRHPCDLFSFWTQPFDRNFFAARFVLWASNHLTKEKRK